MSDLPTALRDMREQARGDDRPALTLYSGRSRVGSISRTELFDGIEALAAHLWARFGVRRGQRIAILSPNRLEVPLLVLALLRLGAVVVPLNPAGSPDAWDYALRNAGTRGVFASGELALHPIVRAFEFVGDLDALGAVARCAPSKHAPVEDRDALASEPAILLYTSGTTANPKGVALPHAALLANAAGMARRFGLDGETQLAVLPLYHAHAFGFGLMTSLLSRGHLVFTAGLDALAWEHVVREEGVSVASVVPVQLQALRQARVRRARVPKLRALLSSSAPLSVDIAQAFERETGVPLLHGWGLSEYTNFACALSPMMSDADRRRMLSAREVPSMGWALDDTEVAALDAEGRPVSDGTRGELAIRGPSTMLGYWGDAAATSAVLRDGWLRSGDEGYALADEQGRRHFHVTGRIKEIIVRGGDKFSPLAIESILVRGAAALQGHVVVLGFAHEIYGEEVGAYVEDSSDDGGLAKLAASVASTLPDASRPKVILYGPAPVPRTHTGKVQRRTLLPSFVAHRQVRGVLTCVQRTSFET